MRKNLREKAKNTQINFADEMQRIEAIFSNKGIIEFYKRDDYTHMFPQYTSIEDLYECGYFMKYPYSENYINLSDMRSSLGISKEDVKENNLEIMLDYFECIYNLISFLFVQYRAGNLSLDIVDERYIYKIINNITNVLEKINYKLVQAEDGYFNIIEKDASTTAVAELYSDISANVIEYRRYNLKGNLERKKEILYNLSNKFEPIRATLKANNFSEIEDKTGDLLNNLDIRHNNKSGKNAKDIVKNMSNEELEQWYDKTYDLLLMCFMFNNYLSFRDDIKDLNKNLKNKV